MTVVTAPKMLRPARPHPRRLRADVVVTGAKVAAIDRMQYFAGLGGSYRGPPDLVEIVRVEVITLHAGMPLPVRSPAAPGWRDSLALRYSTARIMFDLPITDRSARAALRFSSRRHCRYNTVLTEEDTRAKSLHEDYGQIGTVTNRRALPCRKS